MESTASIPRWKSATLSVIFLSCATFYCDSIASWIDVRSISFKEGAPFNAENIETSVEDYTGTMQILESNINTIKGMKSEYRFKIVGYTDNQECNGSTCNVLSLRRARLVYAWLVAHGVLADQLLPPEGHGSSDPTNDNSTPVKRARNRRVEFQIISISPAT